MAMGHGEKAFYTVVYTPELRCYRGLWDMIAVRVVSG